MHGTTSRFASDSSPASRLPAALDHVQDGWAVFPIWWTVNGTCACYQNAACEHPGKHPLYCGDCRLLHGFKEATQDPERIRCWWRHHPLANIGGATGASSNRNAIDVDPRHGGHLYHAADGGVRIFDNGVLVLELPRTRLHASGGGGWHVIVPYGSAPRIAAGNAVALKSDGGYIILPGSVHESGGQYAVLDQSPPCPPYAATGVCSLERPGDQPSALGIHQSKPQNADPGTFIATAIAWIKRQYGLTRIADGQRRQDTLARCGFYLRRQGLSGEDAVGVLLAVNRQICDPPLPLSRFNGLAERIDKKPSGVTPTLSPEARPAIRQLHRAVIATTWRGPRAINAKKLLLVWIDTARRTDQLTNAISDMRAAELAGMGYKTAGRARRYLIAHRWLLPHHGGGRGRTGAHTLTLPAPEIMPTDTRSAPRNNRIDDPTISYGESGLVGQTILFSADQFRQGQGRLGAIGLQILQALDTGTTYKNAAVLARSLGLLPDTAQKKLKLLAKFNLAVKRKDGWRRGPAALEVTYNARNRDVVLHRAERVLHHADLAARGIKVEVDTPTIRLWELRQHGLTRRPRLLRALLAVKNNTAPDLAAKILPDYGDDRKVVLIDAYRNTLTAGSATAPVCKRSLGQGTKR